MASMKNAHALLIGIANYQYIKKLPEHVLNDVQDMYEILVKSDICGYPVSNVTLLNEANATKDGIITALGKLAKRCEENPNSTTLIYISCHQYGKNILIL